MTDIEQAKKILEENAYSCVLVKNDISYTSHKKGIAPLMDWIAEGLDMQGFCVADKTVGKAAAMLFVFAGIQEVHASIISKHALNFLLKYEIQTTYDSLVPAIVNRDNTGLCPMEQAVVDVESTDEAFLVLKNQIVRMQNRKDEIKK